MVFSKILYCHRALFCGPVGIAPDLVASTNLSGMENRTHHRNTCSELAFVSIDNGIHSYPKGVLQAT